MSLGAGLLGSMLMIPVGVAVGRLTTLSKQLQRELAERKRAEAQLRETVAALERFSRSGVGRELRMIELKRQVNELAEQLGKEAPYDLSLLGE